MKNTQLKIAIALSFIWIGFVCSISFMESWLKFQAPGMTTKLGVGIGQLVFSALNKVEIICALLIVYALIRVNKRFITRRIVFTFSIVFTILIIQTVWLLPYLNNRANHLIHDMEVAKSNVHLIYVIFEVIKLVCLTSFGVTLLNKQLFRT